MNRVYKVIWSKAKNCYVVASELAKSHTKASKSGTGNRMLTAGVLACVLSAGFGVPVLAANGSNAYSAGNGNAQGAYSIAIGDTSENPEDTAITEATAVRAIAIGPAAHAFGVDSVAFGTLSEALGTGSISVGTANWVGGNNSVSVGRQSTVIPNVKNALVLGNSVEVNNGIPDGWDIMTDAEKIAWAESQPDENIKEGVVAVGNNISVSLNNKAENSRSSTSDGDPAITHVVALGDNVIIGEENAIGIGHSAKAIALDTLAMGEDAWATAEGANAVGSSTRATGSFANALGYNAQALDEGAGAFGQDAQATSKFATAFGRSTRAIAESATAIGNTAQAVSQSAIAIGTSSLANGGANTNVLAIGRGATVGSTTQGYGESVALGGGSSVQNSYGTAVGSSGNVTGQKGTALGYNASVTVANAVALGADSIANAADTVSVGSSSAKRRIVNVTDGVGNSDVSTVGQTGRTLALSGNSLSLKNANGTVLNSVTLPDSSVSYIGIKGSDTGTGSNRDGSGAVGLNAIAIGNNASTKEDNSVAIGNGAATLSLNAVAIGSGAVAKNANEVSFGHDADDYDPYGSPYGSVLNKKLTHVADGVNDHDVSTVGQLNTEVSARTEADATLIERIGSLAENGNYIRSSAVTDVSANLRILDTQLKATNQNISGFATDISRNKDNIRELNTSVTSALESVSTTGMMVDTINNLKADTSLNNLSAAGQQVITNAAVNAVQEYLAANSILGVSRPMMASASPTASNTLYVTDAGNGSLHVGEGSYVNGASSIAIGVGNQVNANNAGAFGDPSIINADGSYVLGNDDTVNTGAVNSFIVGNDSVSNAEGSLIMGSHVTSNGKNGMALGNSSSVSAENAVALGYASVADEENTLSIGNDSLKRRIVNVADGNLTAGSSDAVTGSQLYATNERVKANEEAITKKADVDASNINIDKWIEKLGTGKIEDGNGGLVTGGTVYDAVTNMKDAITNASPVKVDGDNIYIGGDMGGNTISVANNKGDGRVITGVATNPQDASSAANVGYVNAVGQNIVKGVSDAFTRVNDRMDKVGAGAAAMAGLVPGPMDGDERWSLSAGVGNYRSATAGAIGAFYKPSDNVMLAVKGAFGNGENMVSGSVGVSLNKGDVPGVTKAQMVRTINAQANEIREMKAMWQQDRAKISQLESVLQQILTARAEVQESAE